MDVSVAFYGDIFGAQGVHDPLAIRNNYVVFNSNILAVVFGLFFVEIVHGNNSNRRTTVLMAKIVEYVVFD